MITNDYIILAPQGMHARPATALIKLVKTFRSAVTLQKGGKTIKLNSMLNLLSLAIKGGDTVTVTVNGEDETGAAAAIGQFFSEQLKDL